MERIGFWKVAGKTWLLVRARARIFLLYWLGMLFFPLLRLFLLRPDAQVSAFVLIFQLASLCAISVVGLSLSHFTVSSCRNETSFLPDRPVRAFVRYSLVSLAVLLVGLVCLLLAGLPLVGVLAIDALDAEEYLVLKSLLVLAGGVLAGLGGLIPLLRLGFATVAIAVNEDGGLKRAWRTTRGYTLKLLAAFFLFLSPPFFMGIAWGLLGSGSTDSLAFRFADTLGTMSTMFFLSIYLCVLYQDLFLTPRESMKRVLDAQGPTVQIRVSDTH